VRGLPLEAHVTELLLVFEVIEFERISAATQEEDTRGFVADILTRGDPTIDGSRGAPAGAVIAAIAIAVAAAIYFAIT